MTTNPLPRVGVLTFQVLPYSALLEDVQFAERAESLRALGADVVEGDFLDYHSVERAVQGVSTVYFAYPVQAGLLEATAIMGMRRARPVSLAS